MMPARKRELLDKSTPEPGEFGSSALGLAMRRHPILIAIRVSMFSTRELSRLSRSSGLRVSRSSPPGARTTHLALVFAFLRREDTKAILSGLRGGIPAARRDAARRVPLEGSRALGRERRRVRRDTGCTPTQASRAAACQARTAHTHERCKPPLGRTEENLLACV